MSVYIGIDPGKGGGLALIAQGWCWSTPMPDSDAEMISWLDDTNCPKRECRCVIEHVHAMPGQGVTSMFTFGEQFGRVRMACTALGIPYELVRPQKWQKELGLLSTKGESHSERKRRFKRRAEELFPGQKVTLKTADALLLAEYCRRLFG